MNKNFWQLIGPRRSKGFFIVFGVNAAIIAALILWFVPQQEASKTAFAKTEQDKLALQNQIVELPKKYAQMKANEDAYDALRLRGFFTMQDRIQFKQILNDLRTSSGVRQVAYDIKPQQIIENKALVNTDKQLLSSDVTVTLKGLTDLEMRSFVHVLQDAILGFSTISRQSFKRDAELNDANLIKLGNGEPVDFIQSEYTFSWYTLYDKPDPLGMNAPAAPPVNTVPGMPVPAANPAAPSIPPVTQTAPPAVAAPATPAPVAPPAGGQ